VPGLRTSPATPDAGVTTEGGGSRYCKKLNPVIVAGPKSWLTVFTKNAGLVTVKS